VPIALLHRIFFLGITDLVVEMSAAVTIIYAHAEGMMIAADANEFGKAHVQCKFVPV